MANGSNQKMMEESTAPADKQEKGGFPARGLYFPPGDLDDMIFFDSDAPLHSER